jgi:toxin-antitoxin system PIN domain toxin
VILLDVNVLVYAHKVEALEHRDFAAWLTKLVESDQAFALSDIVLSGFLRIVTHPRIYDPPSSVEVALAFVEELRSQPNCLIIEIGTRHWHIFTKLCRQVNARGNAIPDAYLAALAIESGSELVTADRGFARFPGLRWRYPLKP